MNDMKKEEEDWATAYGDWNIAPWVLLWSLTVSTNKYILKFLVFFNDFAPGFLELDPQTQFCITNFGKNMSGDTNLEWAEPLTPRLCHDPNVQAYGKDDQCKNRTYPRYTKICVWLLISEIYCSIYLLCLWQYMFIFICKKCADIT
jgi:hypothetical protein